MSNIEDRDLLIKLFDKYSSLLTQNQKQIFQLFYFEDLSLAEIAEICATTRSAVFDSLKKTKTKLTKFYKEIEKGEIDV
ncbi:sigma factor-like helix-turn-helix DNA-binding protein [Mycoplasma sp. AC157]|uniref:sigma factor-like helix-turn-helix DNA-binding protein n=1 Tax=Mycoplasma sp. 480 TaxID=3440155 RepID=UPI003F5170B3